MAKPIELLGLSDIANEMGVTRQAIQLRYSQGQLPTPDAMNNDRPLWKRKTLERAKVL